MKFARYECLHTAKILLFFIAITGMMSIGFMLHLRPEVSETEKRTLAKFPQISAIGLWDGTYFRDISKWYADTYPLREEMISLKSSLENLYGNRNEQIIFAAAPKEPQTSDSEETAPPQEKQEEENLPDGTVRNTGEICQGIYIVNNRGYELYTFLEDLNLNFIATMNKIYERISPKVNMYVMMVPTAAGVMIDDNIMLSMSLSSQTAAIDYINERLDPGIKKVDTIHILKKHNAEYIYFGTDHHWTARGAYYAYVSFCRAKGIEPHDINDYESVSYPGFLGTLYAFSKKSPALAANPDTVVAYIPKGTNRMTVFENVGKGGECNIINDLSSGHPSALYSTFVMGDHPFSYAHNETIKDGSAVLLIKDSMGNALVPWLVDHYEHIYWADARYINSTISRLVAAYNIKDVIFEVGIYNGAKPDMHKRYDEIGR